MRTWVIVALVLIATALYCYQIAVAQPRYGAYLPLVAADCEVRNAWDNTCYAFWP